LVCAEDEDAFHLVRTLSHGSLRSAFQHHLDVFFNHSQEHARPDSIQGSTALLAVRTSPNASGSIAVGGRVDGSVGASANVPDGLARPCLPQCASATFLHDPSQAGCPQECCSAAHLPFSHIPGALALLPVQWALPVEALPSHLFAKSSTIHGAAFTAAGYAFSPQLSLTSNGGAVPAVRLWLQHAPPADAAIAFHVSYHVLHTTSRLDAAPTEADWATGE